MLTRTLEVLPVTTSTPLMSAVLKLFFSTLIPKKPGLSSGNKNCPSEFVVSVLVPVAPEMVILAPGTIAPEESTTVPERLPRTDDSADPCAHAPTAAIDSASTKQTTVRCLIILFLLLTSTPQCGGVAQGVARCVQRSDVGRSISANASKTRQTSPYVVKRPPPEAHGATLIP